MKRFKIVTRTIVLFLMTASASASADFHVVVHSKLKRSQISKDELRDIYLGNRTHWEDGKRIRAAQVDLPTVTEEFSMVILNLSVFQFESHWRRKLFSGQGLPPKKLMDDAAVISFVARNKGAIGFIKSKMSSKDTKVLKVSSQSAKPKSSK